MTDTTTNPLQSQHVSNGDVEAKFSLTPASDTKGYHFYIPPDHVVPVIFVPGIMGSNLVNINNRDEKVWPAYSGLSLAAKWAFRGADTRQIKLSSNVTDLDHTGPWYGVSKTVHNEAEGLKRGQGTTSKEFYGNFCVWLDNQLNSTTDEHSENASPCARYCYTPKSGEPWHAQKAFAPFSLIDARKIWSKFLCPVYVQGYNWTLSNAVNGQRLADRIKSIIEEPLLNSQWVVWQVKGGRDPGAANP
ncbi:hypothetical protein ACQUFY_00705 [Robbsia andropogonis]|uniref:hypothetical protein n=1 Tax=Robbsia andropogonis TaxID=28092 RepID=UPI003D1CE592